MGEVITREATAEIEDILTGCRSGRLRHNQEIFHCGTAHCIAGWHEVRKEEESTCGIGSPWQNAQKDWGLSESEATLFFASNAVFPLQFAVLETLKAGYRLQKDSRFLQHLRDVLGTVSRSYRCEKGLAVSSKGKTVSQDLEREWWKEARPDFLERVGGLKRQLERHTGKQAEAERYLLDRVLAYEYPKEELVELAEILLNKPTDRPGRKIEVEEIILEEVVMNG